jgi:hypothetical protein
MKLPDPSQASPTSHQQPRHLDKAAKPTVSRYIPWSKFPPREHFVPKGFSKSFLPNSSGYEVITTTNLAIPAHKDGSQNTSNQVFSQLLRCQTTLTNTPILVKGSFEVIKQVQNTCNHINSQVNAILKEWKRISYGTMRCVSTLSLHDMGDSTSKDESPNIHVEAK